MTVKQLWNSYQAEQKQKRRIVEQLEACEERLSKARAYLDEVAL